MKPKARILLKIVELLGCIACVVTKLLSDQEARRLFIINQKLSREWSLLNNITWSTAGNAFANITYGGYTLITALMVISRFIDPKTKPNLTEKIFLTMGILMFFAMGGLVFAAIDQVPTPLHDNAIIMGCLSFFVAFLFIYDLADPVVHQTADGTQTDQSVFDVESGVHSYRLGEKIEVNQNAMKMADVNPLGVQITAHDVPLLDRSHMVPQGGGTDTPGKYQQTQDGDTNYIQTITLPVEENAIVARLDTMEKNKDGKTVPVGGRKLIPNPFISKQHVVNWKRIDIDNPPQSVYRKVRGSIQINPNTDFSSTNSYVSGEPVDRGNFILRKSNVCYIPPSHSQFEDLNYESSTPITPGYVANAARRWENRLSSTNQKQPITVNHSETLSTIV